MVPALVKHNNMNKKISLNSLLVLRSATGLIGIVLSCAVSAQDSCPESVGKFLSIEGLVEVAHTDQGALQTARLDTVLCQDDTIQVGSNSRAAVQLINEVMLRLDQNTTMRLIDVAPQPEKSSFLELIAGAFKSFSRPPRTFSVNTPYINGIIEGTEFAMRVEGDSTLVTVYEGKVNTSNEQGRLLLAKGESALAKAGQAPKPYVLVKPRDAVQWTLHFPPVLSALGGGDRNIPQGTTPQVEEALGLAARGDSPGAIALLDQVPASEHNTRYHLVRAALYLDVGRVDEARAELDRTLERDPKAGLAYALRSVIAVVRNEKAQALSDAEKAVALSPSAASKIALSYAQQADFRLEAARDTLLSAVKDHPDDPLAWARLAELRLMFGERDEALEAARQAEELAPGLARTQTVLGFAALAENREADAKAAFERAVGLDSDDPLAHFGLGLVKIKSGDIAEGRAEIEGAVALDSSNALLRSYLGKSYYEEKRHPLDEQQYEIAKELDPADPTPYFYDAIDKQTTNRPVEALHDMQKAIELNDNRAVYRSRQLLDSDLAARSASLARVYTDLGFQPRALVEGWKSVNADPGNFSAHRFLADSYSVLPRHEIARVSELLQSQLLQPLNMTPIQPRLAESNLFLISAGGPGGLSFNEFNPVFNRDGFTFQSSGLIGENNTYAGEGVVSGIYKNASFSFGGLHFTSDGFRQNADQKDDIGDGFLQLEVSPQTSIQAEYRYRNTVRGDLNLRFFPENFFPGERNRAERNTYRFGIRHAFAPNSTLLGSFTYQTAHSSLNDEQPPEPDLISIGLQRPEQAYGGELQHLFHSEFISVTSGVGFFDINGRIDANTGIDLPPPITIQTTIDQDVRHVNAYAYSYIHPLEKVTLTLGGSGDFVDSDSPDFRSANQLNPKFGILWEPVSGTLLRAAAFRTLKRTLITNQTLEPTQVAGFNQFFDDINGTEAWRYGAALDQIVSRELYAGVEFSYRDLRVPFLDFSDPQTPTSRRVNWEEYLGHAYILWTPHEWVALRTEYQYERARRPEELTNGVKKMNTHRVPFGGSFFHPSGLGATVRTTYFHQDGEFEAISGRTFQSGTSDFWVVDAAVSYRLPKRYGFVTIGATNLLDRQFNYFDTDFNNPIIQPKRTVFGRITLALP